MPPAALISAMTNWAASSKLLMALVLSPLTSHSPMIFTGAVSFRVEAVVAVVPAVVPAAAVVAAAAVVVAAAVVAVVAAAAAVVAAAAAVVDAESSSSS